MTSKRRKNDGRTTDFSLMWLTKNHGQNWEIWRKLASEWIILQESKINDRLDGLRILFELYLVPTAPWTVNPITLFEGMENGWKASAAELRYIVLQNSNRSDNASLTQTLNYITDFLDWVLDTHFSEKNDDGKTVRLYINPIEKNIPKINTSETVHNPLPYRYICDIRHILCPKARGHFSDWLWAQGSTEGKRKKSDGWFEVDENLIDKSDPDCVWDSEKIISNGKPITIYYLWSPVCAMVLFIKLHLPLRTYQVRMLDSGEADSLRYEKSDWIENTKHNFVINKYSKGVFCRFEDKAIGSISTGLYINTNKTADQNKDEFEKGYKIPWQNEDVLYWLEKLRNWQEKYNSIDKPVDCINLERKHTGKQKSYISLSAMGHSCFLMRDASANKLDDRSKPIPDMPIHILWYKLLSKFEDSLLISGDTLLNGSRLRLVHNYGEEHTTTKTKTEFPLHSLRVSLITCYIMDAKLPLPVVSKLLAGHSRILMTVYYTKLTPATMKEKMNVAEEHLKDKSEESARIFLKDAEIRQIECKMAYLDGESVQAALVNRNPLGWENRHHGLCLAGGNTVKPDESKTVAGCWNGGDVVTDSKNASNRVYGSVSHGPENCVRCRWFITDARYLPALNAHLNFMSYKAYEAANLAVKLEKEIEYIEDEKYEAEINNKPFTKHNELQAIQRRYEKQLIEADEFAKDWIATFNLIRRLIEIEQERIENDNRNKFVAVGAKNDIKIGFMETNSELLHLSLLCEDAEIYPDIRDDVKKTPIIQERTQNLSRIMMSKGYTPQLLMLDIDQQLFAANAMMRQMILQANPTDKIDGFKQVTKYLELGQYMEDSKLLDIGMMELVNQTKQNLNGISIKSFKSKGKRGKLSYAN